MYIGIDPGLTGAVGLLSEDGTQVFDTPTVNTKGSKHEYVPTLMADILRGIKRPQMAFIERQRSMPSQGVSSVFSLGYGYGLWLGILAGLGIPVTVIEPSRWKQLMLRDMPKEKESSRLRAIQLWPAMSQDLSLKKHHGRAEALLIAEYGRRQSQATVETPHLVVGSQPPERP